MTLRQFIKNNRLMIDKAINECLNNPAGTKQNDRERELWILNDEGLYHWARSEGVRL